MSETLRLHEVTAETLTEAAVTEDGATLLRIIGPGWSGNGRYYPAEVLERDGPDVFVEGTRTFIDHPARSEETDRPERSVRDLAGTLTEDARWEADGPAGPGLYAEARIVDDYRPLIDDLADVVGPSIRAEGTGEHGEAEGRQGTIITSITSAESVDYVTRPAAGGRVLSLIEAVRDHRLEEARNAAHWLEAHIHRSFTDVADRLFAEGHLSREERMALSSAIGDALTAFNAAVEDQVPQLADRDPFADPEPPDTDLQEAVRLLTEAGWQVSESGNPQGGTPMPEPRDGDPTVAELTESVTELNSRVETLESERDDATARAERAEEALTVRDARDHARAVLDGLDDIDLTEAAQTRVIDTSVRNIPTDDDDGLDRDALAETVEEAAREEHAYIAEAAGIGRPRSTGGDPTRTDTDDVKAQLIEGAMARGLTEEQAKQFAEGRR